MRHLILIFFSFLFVTTAECETQKTIGIFTYKVLGQKPWDPDSIQSGIMGSEEAVIYMSQKLAELGFKVVVFADPPAESLYSLPQANPRFVDHCFDDGKNELFDIAISWRMPDAAERLKKRARHVYLWPHDTFHWKLADEQINGFDDVIWLSKWHREQWIQVNPGFAKFTKIFGNGVNPDQFKEVKERKNPYSCVYGSNYARGLEILLDIWPLVKLEYPKATLDIYYGWQHWGLLSPEKEAKMRLQITNMAALGVQEHGLVSHEELNRAYEKASFWTYPCICPEIFCITAIRAQLAGAVPVIITSAALPETVPFGYKCYDAKEYLATLLKAMRDAEKITQEERKKMSEFVQSKYTWKVQATKWKELFDAKSSREYAQEVDVANKTVLLAILAKNKAHMLPQFLRCIENLDYDKKLISIYINTNNNEDNTIEILQAWAKKNEPLYRHICFESHEVQGAAPTKPHEWTFERFKILGGIRNKSLQKAKEYNTDYYFVVDCDNFIIPSTLKHIMAKDKPIVAPMLRALPEPGDTYANFYCDTTETGYFKGHPDYEKIVSREMVGTFKVPVAHCTYLIKSEYIDQLTYVDETLDYEYVVFSRSALKNNIDQYICNEKDFGTLLHYLQILTL